MGRDINIPLVDSKPTGGGCGAGDCFSKCININEELGFWLGKVLPDLVSSKNGAYRVKVQQPIRALRKGCAAANRQQKTQQSIDVK